MEEIRDWPDEDENLDFIVATEPQFQPHLRPLVGTPLLNEGWKPSTTNIEMIPGPSAQTPRVKKVLIRDYYMVRTLPYHPQVWVDRGATFLTVGYGELAVADSYKAHLLFRAASVEEITAREPGDGSLTANVFSAILSKLPQAENESLEAYYLLMFSGIKKTHQRAYFIMAQGLLSMNAWHDALAVLREAVIAFPEHWELNVFRRQCMKQYLRLEDRLRIQEKDTETIDSIFKSGQLERVAYPWIVSKDLERSSKSMMRLNAEFEAASENACIQRSPLWGASTRDRVGEEHYGVFAKCKILQRETILFTRSFWTDNKTRIGDNSCLACYCHIPEKLGFCSELCEREANDNYHDIICSKDFSWLHEACREVE